VAARPLVAAAALIGLGWLPYLVILFPGTYSWDGFRQLNEFYEYQPRTTHHPFMATLLMGGLFAAGRGFGVNAALFGYSLVQAGLACLVFAWTCGRVFRLAAAVWRRGWAFAAWAVATAFFALNPVFPVAATTVFKDFPYALGLLTLVNVLVGAVLRRSLSARGMVVFVLGAGATAAFRNDGIVIALAATAGLALILRPGRQRRRALMAGGLVGAGLVLANAAVFPAMGVTKYSNAEMLSLPLQQTARYLRDHPDDVTRAEAATLQSLLKDGRRVEELGANYKAVVSDPVKNRFASFDADRLRRYLGVWWSQLLKHPATYAKATAANTIGYFVPHRQSEIAPISYPRQIHLKAGYWDDLKAKLSRPEADFDPSYPPALAGARAGLIKAVRAVLPASVIWPAFTPALYTWLLAVCAALLAWRRLWRQLWPFAPAGLCLLVCLASPVNGNMRYALPYVVSTPLLVAFALHALATARSRGWPMPSSTPDQPARPPLAPGRSPTRPPAGARRASPGGRVKTE
jgi:hypothetical protein